MKYENHFVHFIIVYKRKVSIKSNKIQIFYELFLYFLRKPLYKFLKT